MDTRGQERYRALTSTYYKKADVVLLMYDICNKKSFFKYYFNNKRFNIWLEKLEIYKSWKKENKKANFDPYQPSLIDEAIMEKIRNNITIAIDKKMVL